MADTAHGNERDFRLHRRQADDAQGDAVANRNFRYGSEAAALWCIINSLAPFHRERRGCQTSAEAAFVGCTIDWTGQMASTKRTSFREWSQTPFWYRASQLIACLMLPSGIALYSIWGTTDYGTPCPLKASNVVSIRSHGSFLCMARGHFLIAMGLCMSSIILLFSTFLIRGIMSKFR